MTKEEFDRLHDFLRYIIEHPEVNIQEFAMVFNDILKTFTVKDEPTKKRQHWSQPGAPVEVSWNIWVTQPPYDKDGRVQCYPWWYGKITCHTCGSAEPNTESGRWAAKMNDTLDCKDWWFCSEECYNNRYQSIECNTCQDSGYASFGIPCPTCKKEEWDK